MKTFIIKYHPNYDVTVAVIDAIDEVAAKNIANESDLIKKGYSISELNKK